MTSSRRLGYPVLDTDSSAINPLLVTAELMSKMCNNPGKTYLKKEENARKAATEGKKVSTATKQNKKTPQPYAPRIKTS